MTIHFGVTMTNKPIRSMLVLALSLSMSLAPAPAVAQAPQAEVAAKPSRLWIETDTQALGERGIGMQAAVTRELRSAFEAEGIELVDKQQPDAVHLRLRFSGTAEDVRVFNYTLNFELIQGKTATQLIEPIACSKCFAEALYNTIAAQVPTLLEAIETEMASNSDTEGSDITPPPGDGDGDVSDPPTGPKPKPIGPVGISGAIGLAVGVGLTIGGGIVLANPKQLDVDTNAQIGVEHDRSRLGIGLLVPGATLVVVGAILIGVDVAKRAKQRKRADTVTIIPTLSPTSAGLGVVGRF